MKKLAVRPKKPRGKPFKPGNQLAKLRQKQTDAQRKAQQDARLIARDASPDAIRRQIEIMNGTVTIEGILDDRGKPIVREAKVSEMLMAAEAVLNRGYGRPPQALEIYGGDVTPEARAGSALEVLESRLTELARRRREAEDPKLLN